MLTAVGTIFGSPAYMSPEYAVAVANAAPSMSAGVESGSGDGHSRAPVRKIAGIALPASVLVAVALLASAGAGAGLWLALGHEGGHLTPTPTHSHAVTATSSGSAVAVRSPYRFAVSGAVERPCGSAIRSAVGGRAASIVFADQTAATVHVFWVDYQGRESPDLHVTLKPGASGKIRGGTGDAWQLDGPRGCLGEFITAAAARVTVENA